MFFEISYDLFHNGSNSISLIKKNITIKLNYFIKLIENNISLWYVNLHFE